jgi:hypothetical protein
VAAVEVNSAVMIVVPDGMCSQSLGTDNSAGSGGFSGGRGRGRNKFGSKRGEERRSIDKREGRRRRALRGGRPGARGAKVAIEPQPGRMIPFLYRCLQQGDSLCKREGRRRAGHQKYKSW